MEHSPKRAAFERMLRVGFALLWLPFLCLLCWRSGDPDVLGIWSWRLLAIAGGYAIALAAAGWFAFHPSVDARRGRLQMVLVGLRQNRLTHLIAIAAPIALAVLAIGAVFALGVVPSLQVIASLGSLLLLVVWAEAFLAIVGRPVKQQRSILIRIAAAGAATLVTLLIIEIAAALLGLNVFAAWDLNPRNLETRFRTDDFDTQVVTNSQGLREAETVAPKAAGVHRVIVIGDSMTFGWGVNNDQAYPKVTETLLRKQHQHSHVEVINMGRPGAGPQDYLKYLSRYAVALDPDQIVIGFLVGNDVPVQAPARLASEDEVESLFQDHLRKANANVDRLLDNSFLLRLAYAVLNRPPAMPTSAAGQRGPLFGEPNPLTPAAVAVVAESLPDKADALARYEQLNADGWIKKGLDWEVNPWLLQSIIKHPYGAADSLAVRAETFAAMEYEWRLAAKLLKEMQRIAAANQATLQVLAIPSAHLASPTWVEFLKQRGCFVNEKMTTERIVNGWLAAWCEENDVPLIDPLARFRAEPDNLYLSTDDHMTIQGHRYLAEELAAAIDETLDGKKR